jgi:hypothetical protein
MDRTSNDQLRRTLSSYRSARPKCGRAMGVDHRGAVDEPGRRWSSVIVGYGYDGARKHEGGAVGARHCLNLTLGGAFSS